MTESLYVFFHNFFLIVVRSDHYLFLKINHDLSNPGLDLIMPFLTNFRNTALILFLIARRGGEAYFERHAQTPRGARMKRWFLEYGLLTVFIPALIPLPILPYKIFAIAAGAFQVRPVTYMIVLTVARILRYFSLAWFGKRFGDNTLS